MLVVLSEIDCIDYLREMGLYPDEYFTDFEIFRNKAVSFRDASILVILAGTCRFSVRHTIEVVKLFYKRQSNSKDSGIKDVIVLSDSTISGLSKYYKFKDNLEKVDEYNKTRCVKKNINLWGTLDDLQTKGEHDIHLYRSDFDKGKINTLETKIRSKVKVDDEYIHLIKVHDVKALINS